MLIDDLKAFLAVAKTGSFSRAALRLRIAQSSLSKRVQRLEQHFGTALLHRHGRGVSLTDAGTVLVARAGRLVHEIEDIEHDVRGIMSEPEGTVRMAMPPATGPALAPLVFRRCLVEHPRIIPQLRESTSAAIHEWLSSGEVDLALIHNPEQGPDFEVQPLVAEPLYLIVPGGSRGDAYPDPCGIDDLAHLPLILPRSPHSIRVLVERLCAGNGIQPNIRYESDSIRSTKGIVALGLGCTVFSRSALADELAQGQLRAIRFTSALLNWKLCLAHARRDNLPLAVSSLKRIILQQVGELFRQGFWPGGRDLRHQHER